jgi:ferredoxin-NADP reductase
VTIETALHDESKVTAEVVVDDVKPEAADVVSLVLRRADGRSLPPWEPGSHIDLILPSGLVRQYSLCGDARDTSAYRVAVLRERNSRGGSEEVHRLTIGQRLYIRGPRNNFDLVGGPDYLFLAGGIGITPIISMIHDASIRGSGWRLVYGGRSRKSMAFIDELQVLRDGAVQIICYDEQGYPDFAHEIAALKPGGVIYACGPSAMLAAVEQHCQRLECVERLHVERFTADRQLARGVTNGDGDCEFEVELARTGVVLKVAAGESLLHVIRTAVPSVLYSCEEGYCGTCETGVLSGVPDHRDEVLTDEEQAVGDTMMICVGRSKTARIVLDI